MSKAEYPTPRELAARFTAELEQAHTRIEEAVPGVDMRAVFARYTLWRLSAGNRITEHGRPMPAAAEHAAWLLYPHFDAGTSRDGARIQEVIDAVEAHAHALAGAEIFPSAEEVHATDQLANHLRLHSGVVRGSAYPQQIARRIDALFRPFEAELATRVGIGPGRAFDVVKALGLEIERSINGRDTAFVVAAEKRKALLRKKKISDEDETELAQLAHELATMVASMDGEWVPSKSDLKQHIGLVSDAEWTALRSAIGFTPARRAQLRSLVQVQDYPLFFLDDEHAFSVHGSHTFDAVFNYFDDVARGDPQLQTRYGDHVAHWMEKQIAAMIMRLFPAASVLRNVCFADPDNPGGEAEADVVVLWGPFLVVLEAKGKRVHRDALRGSLRRLKQTVGNNVQDAFYQARRVIRVLDRDGRVRLKERGTGRVVEVNRDNLRRVMPVSVTLQHLSVVTTQLAVTQRLGLFNGNAFPWSVSIDDLDVVTRFAGSPDVFLHYIERRTAHQTVEISLSGDELDMFGQYLENRPHPDIYEENPEIAKHAGPRMISFDGGEEQFDAVYTAEWYGRPPPDPPISLRLPSQIAPVLEELRRRDDYGARWITFALLGLSTPALAKLNAGIRDLRKTSPAGRRMPRVTAREGDVLVTVIVHDGLDEETFRENAIFRTRIEKYASRAPYAVTIGINRCESAKAFDLALWMEGVWEQQEELDALLAEDRAKTRTMHIFKRGKRIGRNDQCPCGSEKKFKNCCIGRVRFEYRPFSQ